MQAQVDSNVAYYPLHVGDVWQYWYHYDIAYSTKFESTYVFAKVVGDTLMPNGKWYKTLVAPEINQYQTLYQRVDSSSATVYSYVDYPAPSEQPSDSLRLNPDDPSHWEFPCVEIDTTRVLGVQTIIKRFSAPPYMNNVSYAKGFGIVQSYHYEDNPEYPIYDDYTYDLVYARILGKEFGTLAGIQQAIPDLPTRFLLCQNFPNPFNPSTTITFSLVDRGHVELRIYDVLGNQVARLVEGDFPPGSYVTKWNAEHFASGVYFCRLVTTKYTKTIKLLLQR